LEPAAVDGFLEPDIGEVGRTDVADGRETGGKVFAAFAAPTALQKLSVYFSPS